MNKELWDLYDKYGHGYNGNYNNLEEKGGLPCRELTN